MGRALSNLVVVMGRCRLVGFSARMCLACSVSLNRSPIFFRIGSNLDQISNIGVKPDSITTHLHIDGNNDSIGSNHVRLWHRVDGVFGAVVTKKNEKFIIDLTLFFCIYICYFILINNLQF